MDKYNLTKEIASGKHSAYRELFLTYYPKVKYFIAHFMKSDIVAEDLAQDIFFKIWENHEKLASVQSIDAYIYRMAKNTTLNYIEHQYVEKKYMELYEEDIGQNFEDELYAKETELLVQLTVNNMPPQRKKIYLMSREEGLKNDEIAEQLNISKKTVENHLNIALKEIRKAITLLALFFV